MTRADGSDFLAHLNLRAMNSPDGVALGYAGIFRNITQERDAEATVQRFRHILQVLSEGVLVADAEGRITFANEAAESILEYQRGELTDKDVSLLFPSDFKPPMTDILRLAKSQAWRGEVTMLMRNGQITPIQLSVLVGARARRAAAHDGRDHLRHPRPQAARGRAAPPLRARDHRAGGRAPAPRARAARRERAGVDRAAAQPRVPGAHHEDEARASRSALARRSCATPWPSSNASPPTCTRLCSTSSASSRR
jgi:PAS domain S-box-containing protein